MGLKSKINFAIAQKIRIKYGTGKYRQVDLATKYGVSTQTINAVLKNKVWIKPNAENPSGEDNGSSKLTMGQILQIRELYATGKYSQSELGKRFDISSSGIHKVVTGKSWDGKLGPLHDYKPIFKPKNDRERRKLFWSKVDKNGPTSYDGTKCWVWTGNTFRDGYGQHKWHGEVRRAHIISYEINKGATNGLQVLHHCDNRICVRPSHLWRGTHADNMKDMMEKGRHKSGKWDKII